MSQFAALAAGGAALSAVGQYQQGRAAQNAANFNAAQMEREATIARQQGGAREEAQRRRAREVLGTMRASIGQAGIGWGGSAADIYDQSATNAELDALNIRYESDLQSMGLMNQAALTRYEGKMAKRAGTIGAVSSLLTGAALYGASGGFSGGSGLGSGISASGGAGTGFRASGGLGFKAGV